MGLWVNGAEAPGFRVGGRDFAKIGVVSVPVIKPPIHTSIASIDRDVISATLMEMASEAPTGRCSKTVSS